MKIANRYIILSLQLAAFGCFLGLTFARAEAAVPTVSMPAAVESPSASANSLDDPPPVESKMASAAIAAADVKQEADDPSPLADFKKDPKKAGRESDAPDVKVPDSVKTIINNLSTANSNMTLDDLNAAREAIARLDVLIDIEKRLVDLDKIRDERAKRSVVGAGAIPASALSLPSSSRFSSRMAEITPPAQPERMEIIYIEGSNGRYSALVRDGKNTRYIRGGDHLRNGATVLAVTPEGVETIKDKVRHLEQVKDVQTVFGDSP